MRRPGLLPLAVSLALAFGPFAARGADDAPDRDEAKPVAAPHYGDALFHFYQGRYFSTATNILVSQHFDRLAPHDDDAEILRGGLLLSYGVHDEAEAIFNRLIERGASAATRDRAWFFLAKLRYQRNLPEGAEAALQKVGEALPPALEDERVLLLAQLQMARGGYADAVQTLEPLAQRPLDAKRPQALAPMYAKYNQGIALLELGDAARGTALLEAIGQLKAPFEEQRALRDKANLALGFAALRASEPEKARGHLERVRLAGLQSNKALLGFGWAASALKAHDAALVPWMELMQRDPSDAAVLEARIAVPYAYAELGALGQAMTGYTEAVSLFEKEAAALDESVSAVRSGRLVAALMERNPGEEMGWLWSLQALPELPHPSHLAPVMAQHAFQEAFKNYRDLVFLTGNLRGWAEKLVVFDDMLANRRQAYAERLPKYLAQAKQVNVGVLEQQAAALDAEVQRAAQAADGRALATERQLELMALLDRVQAVLDQAGNDAEAAVARERHRLAAGAMTWQLAQEHSARLWAVQKELGALKTALAEAREREARVAQAPKEEPVRLEDFAKRLAALAKRIDGLLPTVVALSLEQQAVVQDIAVAELQRQKERLAEYTAQARFAMAQLFDQANSQRRSGDAAQ